MVTHRKIKPVLKKGEVVAEAAPMEEDRRPPVTQVVEVVEDAPDEETISAEAESREGLPPAVSVSDENDESHDELSSPADASESDPDTQDDKRRVLVDELFQKQDSTSEELTPEISIHKRSPSGSMMTWAIVSIVSCLVVGGGLFLFSNKQYVTSLFASPTPTATPSPEPTPVPKTDLPRDAVSVEVLNGSGVVGAAGKMKTFLEEKGYTVSDTGNAANYDYTDMEIYVKEGKEAYLTLLANDLKETYTIGTTAATLEEDVEVDARIIVGKE